MKQYLSALALAAGVVMAQDSTALVTFYAVSSPEIPYHGPIYDGAKKAVKRFPDHQFVTLRMKAGPHSFAGQNINGQRTNRSDPAMDLRVTLLPSQHYYIRVTLKDDGISTLEHLDLPPSTPPEVNLVRHLVTVLTVTPCSEFPQCER